jgi:hypothetical protein
VLEYARERFLIAFTAVLRVQVCFPKALFRPLRCAIFMGCCLLRSSAMLYHVGGMREGYDEMR